MLVHLNETLGRLAVVVGAACVLGSLSNAAIGQTITTSALRAGNVGLSVTEEKAGLKITDEARTGPFAQAGLLVGDQVIAMNGERTRTERKFVEKLISAATSNQPVAINIVRAGISHTLTLQPATIRQAVVSADPIFQAGLGMDQRSPHRLVIERVRPGSAAFEAGLARDDVITQVGNSPVANMDVLKRTLEQAGGDNVVLEVTRGRASRLFTLKSIDTGILRAALQARSAVATAPREALPTSRP